MLQTPVSWGSLLQLAAADLKACPLCLLPLFALCPLLPCCALCLLAQKRTQRPLVLFRWQRETQTLQGDLWKFFLAGLHRSGYARGGQAAFWFRGHMKGEGSSGERDKRPGETEAGLFFALHLHSLFSVYPPPSPRLQSLADKSFYSENLCD